MLSRPIMMFLLVLYSLPFFVLWLIIGIFTKKDSRFTISKTMWLIAGFGISHGIHEWTEFFEFQFNVRLDPVDALILAVSFYLLIQFSISTLVISGRRNKLLHLISLAPVVLWLSLVRKPPHEFLTSQIGDLYARYSLGLLGCFLTAVVLFMQRTEIRKTGQPGIIRSLYLTSGGFLFYGLLSGLIVPDVPLFPGFPLSYSAFYRETGIPIQAFRTVAMIFIGYQMVRLLRLFEWERMSSLLSAKEELERKVEERTAELAAANEKLKLVIETEPECVKLLAADGSLLQMNRAGLSMIDAESGAQVQGKKMYELVDVRHRQAFKDLTARVFRGEPGTLEFEATGLKGRRIWLETHAAPLRNEKNEIIAFLGVTREITEEKTLREKVRANERFLDAVVENAPVCIKLITSDGLLLRMNRAGLAMIDADSPAQVEGKSMFSFIAPDYQAAFRKLTAGIFEGRSGSLEFEIIGARGRHVWANTRAVPLYNDRHEVIALLGNTLDLTEVRRAEQKLRESESHLRAILDNIPDLAWLKDQECRFIAVNQAFGSAAGISPDSLAGGSDYDAWPKELAEHYRSDDREVMKNRTRKQVEETLVDKDGNIRWIETIKTPIYDEHGRVTGTTGIARDVTGRRKAAEAIRAEQAFRKAIENSIAAGIIAADQSKKQIYVNPAFCRMVGWTEEELLGAEPPYRYWPPEETENINKAFLETLLGRARPGGIELRFMKRSGERFEVLLQNSELKDGAQNTIGWLASVSDITERKKAEGAVAESEKHYRLLFETMLQGIIYHDADGKIVSMNKSAERILGQSAARLMGKASAGMTGDTIREDGSIVPPAETPSAVALRAGRSVHGVIIGVFNPREKAYRWLRVDAVPLYHGAQTRPYQVYTIFTDITERKKAEDLLQRSEKRYRQLFENMHEGLLIQELVEDDTGTPVDVRYLDVNPATERFLGKKRAEIVGKTRNQVLGEPDPEVVAANSSVVKTGQPFHMVRYSAGAGRWYESFSYSIGGGQTATLIMDITERTLAEEKVRQSEAKYRNVFESSMDGIFILDLDGNFIDVNSTAYMRLGYTKEDLFALNISRLDPPEFARLVPERLQLIRDQGFAVFESAHLRKDGTAMPVEINARLIEYEGRQAYLSIIRDITERKKTERKLSELNRDFVIFLENTTDFVYFKDHNSRIRFCSQTMAKVTGHASWRDMIGKHDAEVFPKEIARIYYEEELPVFRTGIPLLNKTDPYYDAQGRMGWVSTSKWPVFDDKNRVTGIFGISRDITEHKKMEEEMRHMAQHDALTGLPNRTLFADILRIEAAQARRSRKKMAVLFLDLDRFKEVNDTLGHDAGDQLLKAVSERITKSVRESDTVARIGGDEFNVILADFTKVEDVVEVTQKIVASFQSAFEIAGQELHVTTSIGISIFPDDNRSTETLLRYADIAMYYAKERGRNNFQFYNPEINSRSLERIRMEGRLRHTINRGELEVYYQPLVSVSTRQIVCAEALVRWRHPEQGILEPRHFISIAEDTGFITSIDEFVLRTTCLNIKSWLDAGLRPVCVTVNLSAREFQNPDLTRKIGQILRETGAPADYLIIEITESLAMDKIERTIKRLNELAEMGVHAAIDDFGTGYSSLNQLKRLPVEKLKIDKSFVRDISTDADDRTIINAVTLMAHTMKLKVTAEGVETEGQFEFLKGLECDEAQGYLFSSPLPAEQFQELIASR